MAKEQQTIKTMRFQPRISFSFAGCAWLFPYHLGVIDSLKTHKTYHKAVYLGASSGALAALVAALGIEPALILDEAQRFAQDAAGRLLGPAGRMSRYVREGLMRHLPDDACLRVKDRLLISVTEWPGMQARLIAGHHCRTRDELLKLLLGSCYIPLYYEKPVWWEGCWLLDGGFKNNQPSLDPFTIKVCPLIDPRQKQVHISPAKRLSYRDVLLPEVKRLPRFFRMGQIDGKRFLENWHEKNGKLGLQELDSTVLPSFMSASRKKQIDTRSPV
ncbi:MAG: patatin-like phospholipase family protein [Oligoflexus sp.]